MRTVAILLALLMTLAGCAKSDKAPEAPGPIAPAPEAPPPVAAPERPAVDVKLPIKPAVKEFVVRLTASAGDEVRARGLYFTNTATGKIEGWTTAHTEGVSFFPVAGGNRWLFLWTQALGHLVDRKTGEAWSWDRTAMTVVAASDDYVLVELHDAAPETQYVVIDASMKPIALFKGAEGPEHSRAQARFSPDGKKVALIGHDKQFTLVDVASGRVESLGNAAPAREGKEAIPSLDLSGDGAQILLTTTFYPGTEWTPQFTSEIRRFTWDGKESVSMLAVPGTGARLSPDGKLVAYETPYQGKLATVVIADATTGEKKAWTRSSSLCYQDDGGVGDRWLADSSGLLLRGSMDRFFLMTPSGTLRTNPVWGAEGAEPMPAPDNAHLLALGDRSLVDLSGRVLHPAPRINGGPADVAPWGSSSKEMLFALPHGGHGGRCGFLLPLPPKVETPATHTFDAPLELQVNTPEDCLTLRLEPGGAAVKCLPNGTRLTVTPDRQTQPLLLAEQPLIDGHYWIHVRTAAGEEGWVAARHEYLTWAQ